MNMIIKNDMTTIYCPSADVVSALRSGLSYQDKSRAYQLKRLSKTVWGRASKKYAELKAQNDDCLLIENADGSISFPSSLVGSFPEILDGIPRIDQRIDTGTAIALPWKNKPHDLRDYQLEAIPLFESNWRGLLNYATGLGKTLTATYAIRAIKRKTLVVCPSKAIAEQFAGILENAFGRERVGFFGDGRHHIKDLTVGIAASVCNHVDLFKKADLGLIVFDETHHIAADTFYTIAQNLGSVGRIFGLTATDYRSDGKDLLITAGCGATLLRRDAYWGITNDWLAKPYFIIQEVDTSGRDIKEDKLKNYKAHVLNCPVMKAQIEGDAAKFIAAGKRVLILVDEIAHGKELSAKLGVPFATGEDKNSRSYIDQFNALKIPGLVATDGVVGEGVDTRPVDVLILANFTASKGAVLQAVGRGLRKTETKSICIILDYIPKNSTMLKRHAYKRIEFYRELTDKVQIKGAK